MYESTYLLLFVDLERRCVEQQSARPLKNYSQNY